MSPYQDEKDGVSAGGNWVEFQSEEKMTGAKKVRFELLANNYLKGEPDYKPRVELVCTDGKYKYADFDSGVALGRPGYPGYFRAIPATGSNLSILWVPAEDVGYGAHRRKP